MAKGRGGKEVVFTRGRESNHFPYTYTAVVANDLTEVPGRSCTFSNWVQFPLTVEPTKQLHSAYPHSSPSIKLFLVPPQGILYITFQGQNRLRNNYRIVRLATRWTNFLVFFFKDKNRVVDMLIFWLNSHFSDQLFKEETIFGDLKLRRTLEGLFHVID
jgi:hypothetical protein